MESLHPLLGRTLVFVAHPDDEAIGCGLLLQQMRDPIVIFATDGAPRSNFFWKSYGSRETYAATRAREAERALGRIGVVHFHFLNEPKAIVDQELYLNLDTAFAALARSVEEEAPDAILSLAYEGGHPDHDACCFVASVIGERYRLPVWEMPLYHRVPQRKERQGFLHGPSMTVPVSSRELVRKRQMLGEYRSQGHVVAEFVPEIEYVRPMQKYDFTAVPHSGELNYQTWQWPMTGADLCQAFKQFLRRPPDPRRKREWGSAA